MKAIDYPSIDWATRDEAEWLKKAENQFWKILDDPQGDNAYSRKQIALAYADAQARDALWMYEHALNEALKSLWSKPSPEEIEAVRNPPEAAKREER
jgi:hypothetical protein